MELDLKRYRNILCGLFLMAALLLLSSCSDGSTAADRLAELCALFPEMPPVRVLCGGTDEDNEACLTSRRAARLYRGDEDGTVDCALLSDCAVALTKTTELFEIHVFRMAGRSDEKPIRALLEGRRKLILGGGLSEYAPAQYYSVVENICILREGNFLYLLVTPDNARIRSYLKK